MNMYGRPDLVHDIEVVDGEHFFAGSVAQFGFQYVSSPDAQGYSASVSGEVFADALVVHGGDEISLSETVSYTDDIRARQLVATALFGYELYNSFDEDQLTLNYPHGA